jgi:hypothetical protein
MRMHLGGTLRPPGIRLSDRQRRRARDGYARLDQDGTRWQRLCCSTTFPKSSYPIQCLDGIANRCKGQLYRGERTHIGWTAREIVLPTVAGSVASGAIIKVAGITGRIRGMKYKRADGQRASVARRARRSANRRIGPVAFAVRNAREHSRRAVLGLAGPGKKISGIMPCTVIRPSDMADNILCRDKHPEWNGERTKMVYGFPSNEKLWARYAELRAESLRRGQGIADATEFYAQTGRKWTKEREIAWPERFNHDECQSSTP